MQVNRIVEEDGKFKVESEDGSRSFGTYDTREEAEKRLGEVEYFKRENNMLVNIVQKVNAEEIRTETIGDHEYIVLPSRTQPPGVVMNRLMYPGKQTDAKIETLNGKAAPIDHPIINGKYIDAQDAVAALNFGAGVNKVVGKAENGAWDVEKWVNKEILENTERGRRLQTAINEKRPIHTSTGVYLRTVPNSGGKNEYGEYDAEVEIIEFNHDAILPDSTGANTPEKGTGIFVNAEGEEVQVVTINLSTDTDYSMSSNAVREMIQKAIAARFPMTENSYAYVEDFNDNNVIYCTERGEFSIGYAMQNGEVELVGEPRSVERKSYYQFNNEGVFSKFVTYLKNMVKSNTNEQHPETDPMKEKMIAALNAAGVETEGLNDDQLFERYNAMISVNSQQPSFTSEDKAALKTEILDEIKANAEAAEKSALVSEIKKLKGNTLTEDELNASPLSVLKQIKAQSQVKGNSSRLPPPSVGSNSGSLLDMKMEGEA